MREDIRYRKGQGHHGRHAFRDFLRIPKKYKAAGLELPPDISLICELGALSDNKAEPCDIETREARIKTAVRFAQSAVTEPEEPVLKHAKREERSSRLPDLSYSYDDGKDLCHRAYRS